MREKEMLLREAQAFPAQTPRPNYMPHRGLTKREYFAGLAMQGLVSAQTYSVTDNTLMARMAVDQSDALIAELSKEEE